MPSKVEFAWTAVEDSLLRQIYPTQGIFACLAVLPNRTRTATRKRLARLGIRKSRQSGAERKQRVDARKSDPHWTVNPSWTEDKTYNRSAEIHREFQLTRIPVEPAANFGTARIRA